MDVHEIMYSAAARLLAIAATREFLVNSRSYYCRLLLPSYLRNFHCSSRVGAAETDPASTSVSAPQSGESEDSLLQDQFEESLREITDISDSVQEFTCADTYREDIWKARLLEEINSRTERKRELQREDCVLEDLRDVLEPLQESSYELKEDFEDEISRRNDDLKELWQRDVSGVYWLRHLMQIRGLPPLVKRKLHGPQHRHYWPAEREYLRRRYARYGQLSGVNPGLLWPTEEELLEKAWLEKEREPELFKTILACQERREEKAHREKQRREEVAAKEAAYDKVLEAYEAKIKQAERQQQESEKEKQKKIMEIQEYFGYAVDPDDPRFQAMMQQKEEQQKKEEKLAKRREREMKMIAQLQATAESLKAADEK